MGFGKFLMCVAGGAAAVACAPAIGAVASLAGLGGAAGGAVGNFGKSFTDNVLRDMVCPIPGSVVFCDLLAVEHSGIYVGDGKIVHLDGSGRIEKVSARVFMDRLDGFNTAISIYVSCSGKNAVGSSHVAELAEKMVGRKREYNLVLDNCHQFTSGCLMDDFDNSSNFLWMLKSEAEERLGSDDWRVWDL